MLKWNQSKIQKLSPTEIWLFIIGRVAVGFGVGIIVEQAFPQYFSRLGFPAVILGLICIAVAFKGYARP
jgi:hypothetical protein